MEDKKREQQLQYFYFGEDDKLIVESNKGVWVDGTPYVKMYGNFTCNAKTMGVIIQHFKNVPVEIGVKETVRHTLDDVVDDILKVYEHTIENYCIIGVDDERVKGYEEELAAKHFETKKIAEAKTLRDSAIEANKKLVDAKSRYESAIEAFNALPWYKRMFKKVEV